MNTNIRIASIAVVASSIAFADDDRPWSASLGTTLEAGETASTRSGNAAVARLFVLGEDWQVEPTLAWTTSQSSELDTFAHSLVPSLDVRWAPVEHLTLVASGWVSALEDPLDEGGSLEASTDWTFSELLTVGGGAGGGWSQAAQWYGTVFGSVDAKGERWRPGISADLTYATVPVSTTGKSTKSLYAFQVGASGHLDVVAGPVVFGPSLSWSGYSYEKKMGKNSTTSAMGMSKANFSGSHSEWNAGAHLSWSATDWLSVQAWGGRRWTEDESSLDATTRTNKQGRLVTSEPLELAEPTVDYAGLSCSVSW